MKDGIATKIGLITIKITGFISTYMSVLMRYQNKVSYIYPHIYTKILYPHENAYKHNAGFWYV